MGKPVCAYVRNVSEGQTFIQFHCADCQLRLTLWVLGMHRYELYVLPTNGFGWQHWYCVIR